MKVKAKSTLSIFLACCLIASCLCGTFLWGASAESEASGNLQKATVPENWEFKGDAYNDFEDTAVSQVYSGCGSIVDDAKQGKVFQYNSTSSSEKSNLILNPTGTGSLVDAGYAAGDTLKLSYKGKGTGSDHVWFALHANASQTSMWQQNKSIGSGYVAYKTDTDWTKKTVTVTLPDTYDSANHSALFMQMTSVNTSALLDDVIIYRTTSVTMEGDTDVVVWDPDPFEYAADNSAYDSANARVGDWYTFTVKSGYTATVTYGGVEVTPDGDGVYAIQIAKGSTLNIQSTKDEPIGEPKTEIVTDFANASAENSLSHEMSFVTDADKGTLVKYTSVGSGTAAKQGRVYLTNENNTLMDMGLKVGDTFYLAIPYKKTTENNSWFRIDAGVGHTPGTFETGGKYIQVGQSTLTGSTGTWLTKIVAVTLPNTFTDEHVGLRLLFSNAESEVLLDDITISLKKPEEPLPEESKPELSIKEPQDEIIIDYDNYGSDAAFNAANGHEKIMATGMDGKDSYMFHSKAFDKGYANTLNWSTASKDQEPTYTIPVLRDTVYDISFKIKISEGETSGWWSFQMMQQNSSIASYSVINLERDKWIECKFSCTTGSDYDYMTFYFNAGNETPEFWMDDICIAVSPLQAFEGWGDTPRDVATITFDDYAVPLADGVTGKWVLKKLPPVMEFPLMLCTCIRVVIAVLCI